MTKQELIENFTVNQLAGMVIDLYESNSRKNDELHIALLNCEKLNIENTKLKSEIKNLKLFSTY